MLSHSHADHSKAVKDVMKTGIDVYTSQGTIDALGLSGHCIHAVRANKQYKIGMKPEEAAVLFADIKKFLLIRGIWCTFSEVYEDGLKFIRIEASIMVKQ